MRLYLFVLLCWSSVVVWAERGQQQPFQPDQSKLPVAAPEGSIVLLGENQEQIEFLSKRGEPVDWPWEDGTLVSSRGGGRSNHVVSTWHFRDADIHAEFLLPKKGSGNSGLYIHGNYELQIIHSYGKDKPGKGDVGSLYGFAKPLVNAARPRDQWQVYDIRYRAPRRGQDGSITEQGSVTAWLNGKLVQDNTRFGEPRSTYHPYRYNTTDYLKGIWETQKKTSVGPLFLQDHDNAVQFRNVWIRPLDDHAHRFAQSGSDNVSSGGKEPLQAKP